MKLVLLTQEDPFYLPEAIDDFIKKIKNTKKHIISLVIVSEASPFGKRENFFNKVKRTYKIFGFNFFVFYTYKYIVRKIVLKKSVAKIVKKHEILLLQLKNSINNKDNVALLKKHSPDAIIIIAGNQIIKKQVLEIPKYGVFNAHSSLLPYYKGLMPTFWVLKNNEKKTGVTVYKLTEGIDNGPIVLQKEIKITPSLTQSELVMQCKRLASDLLIESLALIPDTNNYKQNTGGSYYKFPTRNDVLEFYKIGKKFY